MGLDREWVKRISLQMNTSMEPLPGVPLLEVSGNNRVLVENHKGIVHYGKEKICVKVKFGLISICGRDMEIIYITADKVVLSGEIEMISFKKGCIQ